MTEGFENVLGRLKSIVPHDDNSKWLTPMVSVPWVEDIACRLEDAHEAEMKQLSKAEFHRGYEAGKAARNADEWKLDRERAKVACELRNVVFKEDSHYNLSKIASSVIDPGHGWTMDACATLRDRLIHLLGGNGDTSDLGPDSVDAATADSGDIRPSSVTYDELDNERHKVVRALRGFEPRNGGKPTEEASKLIRCIIGREDCHVACANDLEETRDKLIHLLGGDECNFSGAESDMDAKDAEPNPAETQEESSDHVSLGTQPVTSEQREYADDYCYRGHFEAFKGMAYPMPWDNPAETSEDANGACPNDAPIVSITDELRKFAETFRYEWYNEKDGSVCYTTSDCPPSLDSVNMTDLINGIADRIDEQFDRYCKLWERTATDTAQEVHDSMEAECNELSRDIEMWRDRAEDMLMERDDLQAELAKWKVLADTNAKALLRINAENANYRCEAKRDADVMENLSGQLEDMTRERDELQDRLQAISVLCEQDDG